LLHAKCSQHGYVPAGYAYGNTAANAKETLIFSAILVMVVRTAVWAFMHVLQKRFEYVALQRQLMIGKNATANGLTPAPTPHIELTPLMRGAWIVSLPLLLPADSLLTNALRHSRGLSPAPPPYMKVAPLVRGLWMRCGSALFAPDLVELMAAQTALAMSKRDAATAEPFFLPCRMCSPCISSQVSC